MADTHRVIIMPRALADLEEITAYIGKTSAEGAARMATRIVDAIDSLAFMPNRFKRVVKSRKRGSHIQSFVVRPYVIYYRVNEQPPAAFILRIVHGARRRPRRFE
jgi:plasmid stabilization system protein ParE